MSRLRLFLRGVTSSYVALGATILYSLVSVPLALHFLSKEQFGLWALLTQTTFYLGLLDLGMSPSVGRLLIEHKSRPQAGDYGSLIQTGFLVTVTQGVILLLAGLALAGPLASLFHIPAELRAMFCGLVRWQAVITAGMFATRILRNLLYAHQRNDLINLTQAISLGVALGTLWLSLRRGGGAFSILWANGVAAGFMLLANGWWCWRLRLFPSRGGWSRPSWLQFRTLFAFGKDVFLTQVGSLLIMAAQPLVISRQLGLEAVAAWSVGTKVFFLLCHVLWQLFDTSMPAFAEMLVQKEWDRLRQRFANLLVLTVSLAGVGAVLYAAGNSAFVTVWTQGRIVWSSRYDLLLGLWMILSALIHAQAGLIVATKEIKAMRFIFILEGVVFVGLASLLVRAYGLSGIILGSLCCSLVFSGTYCAWRINRLFGFRKAELERRWLLPLARILIVLAPTGIAAWWLATQWSGLIGLATGTGLLALAGLGLWLRFGLPADLQQELLRRWWPARNNKVDSDRFLS